MTTLQLFDRGKPAPQTPRLTESTARALADPFGIESGVKWTAPKMPLKLEEADAAISALEYRLMPATGKDVGTCLKAMVAAPLVFKTEDDSTWEVRTTVWQMALNDIPPDLLEAATIRRIRASKWFPTVEEFRREIDGELRQRQRMLARAKWLAGEIRNPTVKAEGFKRAPQHERVRDLIAIWTKHENPAKADQYRRELAKLVREEKAAAVREGREPAAWTIGTTDETVSIESPGDIARAVGQANPRVGDRVTDVPDGMEW